MFQPYMYDFDTSNIKFSSKSDNCTLRLERNKNTFNPLRTSKDTNMFGCSNTSIPKR